MPVDLDQPPEGLRVEHTTDRIELRIPMALESGQRWRLIVPFLVSIGLFGGLFAVLGAWVTTIAAWGCGLAWIVLLANATRLRPMLFWPAMARFPEIVLTRHSLEVSDNRGRQAIPLASIRDVGAAGEAVVVDWTGGRFDVARDLVPVERDFLRELIAEHAENARIAELDQGIDLDRPNAAPRAIKALVERDRS